MNLSSEVLKSLEDTYKLNLSWKRSNKNGNICKNSKFYVYTSEKNNIDVDIDVPVIKTNSTYVVLKLDMDKNYYFEVVEVKKDSEGDDNFLATDTLFVPRPPNTITVRTEGLDCRMFDNGFNAFQSILWEPVQGSSRYKVVLSDPNNNKTIESVNNSLTNIKDTNFAIMNVTISSITNNVEGPSKTFELGVGVETPSCITVPDRNVLHEIVEVKIVDGVINYKFKDSSTARFNNPATQYKVVATYDPPRQGLNFILFT